MFSFPLLWSYGSSGSWRILKRWIVTDALAFYCNFVVIVNLLYFLMICDFDHLCIPGWWSTDLVRSQNQWTKGDSWQIGRLFLLRIKVFLNMILMILYYSCLFFNKCFQVLIFSECIQLNDLEEFTEKNDQNLLRMLWLSWELLA